MLCRKWLQDINYKLMR